MFSVGARVVLGWRACIEPQSSLSKYHTFSINNSTIYLLAGTLLNLALSQGINIVIAIVFASEQKIGLSFPLSRGFEGSSDGSYFSVLQRAYHEGITTLSLFSTVLKNFLG